METPKTPPGRNRLFLSALMGSSAPAAAGRFSCERVASPAPVLETSRARPSFILCALLLPFPFHVMASAVM